MKIEVEDERSGLPSASGFERLMGDEGCVGSFELEKHLTDTGNKSAAIRGERIHSVMEGKIPITSLSHSDRICAERLGFEEGRLVEELGFEGATQIKEQRFWAKDSDGMKLFSGKPDVVHVLSDRALVINYKTGHYPPTPIAENKQMLCEAVLLAGGGNFLFKTITVALIHPHVLVDGKISQYITRDIEEIRKMFPIFRITALAAASGMATRRPSEKTCAWCLGRKLNCCPEYIAWKNN